MSDAGIPERVRNFLQRDIDSIEQLEVLLLLRSRPEQSFSPVEVSRILGSTVTSIQERLDRLAGAQLLVQDVLDSTATYRYAPATEEARDLVDGIGEAYKVRRLTVINLIYGKPERDLRSFSDAFKLTRKKDGG